ncbi:PD40 domain-containing protein [Granulicella sp. L60]|uniref:TolB family protein n=1 Tax=Granulicella sp. L60 TaxID=1641866 RepID=UPI00131C31EC|nr:PD40 domain-containing protein [Granulicella sp. L60]
MHLRRFPLLCSLWLAVASPALLHASIADGPLGIFEGQSDVGTVLHPGSAHYDAGQQNYTISGSGENMWFGVDDFHFVWKKMSGDVALSADIAFVGNKGNDHRKAVLMIRQSLDGVSQAVDIARHGDGLTSLQFRTSRSDDMHEVESNLSAPTRVRIEKRGDYVYAYVADVNGRLRPAGASIKLKFGGDFYVGLGVCSHDKDVTETAVFSKVRLTPLPPGKGEPVLYSTLETVTVASTDRRVAYVAPKHFEAPNWSRDGAFLIFNQEGTIRRLAVGGDDPALVQTGDRTQCNNDHGISPDGSRLALSDQSAGDRISHIYVVPIAGGTPQQVTPKAPSYFHGWSPDGSTLVFTRERNGKFDIYAIPVTGGQERRLTEATGLNDGPEYSPDGAYIYFNSGRSGTMQIWRMRTDGSAQEQVLADESNDWFSHISPDGRWLVFLAYDKGVQGHPANQDVELRLMSLSDKKVHVLAKLFGGQGTMNVASWSPDSKKLAFVSYELIAQPEVPIE